MKIAIVGGGASGLVCAITAAKMSKEKFSDCSVTVFESRERVGKKILATGNGRCNMLNMDKNPFYFSENGFHQYVIKKYDASSNIRFFSEMGLFTRCDDEGRVYPLSNQAASVLDFLRNECELYGVRIVSDCEITSIKKNDSQFLLNDKYKFDRVVLACGGKAGVKDFNGYELLRQLKHPVTEIFPALTKINTVDPSDVKQLQGIRHKVSLSLYFDKKIVAEEKGELLFARYGISGIAVMQLSSFVARAEKKNLVTISADLAPDFSSSKLTELLTKRVLHDGRMPCGDILSGFMPKKLSEIVVKRAGISVSQNASLLDIKQIENLVKIAKKYKFKVDSLRSFDDAQVTAGGADTAYFDNKTMQSKLASGLYAVGELLDVDGLCGGYNLMWAWSSGRLCGENVIK